MNKKIEKILHYKGYYIYTRIDARNHSDKTFSVTVREKFASGHCILKTFPKLTAEKEREAIEKAKVWVDDLLTKNKTQALS